MALPKLRFIWSPAVIEGAKWRFGLFCLHDLRAKSAGRRRAWRVLISLRGALAWFLIFSVVAYFAGAAVLWRWLDRHPYNKVGYTDLVWPARWSHLQQKRGQTMIAEGLEDFKNQKWRDGEAALRVGISRAPSDAKARLELARFYVAINQRTRAKAVLGAGLAYGYPGGDYFQQVCALAADGEDYAWWISACDTVLAQLAGNPEHAVDRKDAMLQKMSALMAADRPDDVVKLVDAQVNNRSPMFDEFKVLALLKSGKPAAATAFLDRWSKRDGTSAQLVRLQVRAFRESGRIDDMERSIAALCAYNPAAPQPYIYGVIQSLLAGRRTQAGKGIDDFLLRFGGSSTVLAAFADPLAEIGEQPALERLSGYARQQGFEVEPFQRALIKVWMDKGSWSQARALLSQMRSNGKVYPPGLEFWHELMERLCDAAADPAGGTQSSLADLIRNRRISLKVDRQLIESLRRARRPETARAVITIAQGVYPDATILNTWRDELDKELAELQEARPVVVSAKASVPAAVPVSGAPAPLRVDFKEDAFFNGLAELKKTGDFTGALKLIQDMRSAQPEWLHVRENEIEAEEILLNGRVGDLPALHLAAGFYINGDAMHSRKAGELARELYAADCKEAAILLARDLLRKVPDYPTAKRLLAEWEPKPAAPAP